jgi:uroporphyrinogen decarboxylase
LTSRERVRKALNHQESDRVPLDLGSTSTTTITAAAYNRLKKYLNVKGQTNVIDKPQQIVKPSEDILRKLRIDTRSIWLEGLGEPKILPNNSYIDEWGITRKMAKDGYCYGIVDSPLRNASISDLDKYDWPDPYAFERTKGLEEEAQKLWEETDYAIVANFTASIFGHAQHLRGLEAFLVDMLTNQRFAEKLMDKILEFHLIIAESFFQSVGRYLDVVKLADDVATQNEPLISLELYRKLIKPRQRELISFIKKRTNAKVFLHSCGAVHPFINDFIEIGADILNPVQVSASGMDTRKLKEEFGDKIVLWGGIDTQRVLPYGTVQDVENEVRRRIRDLAPGGGYVLSAVHNIQPDVSPQNICTMYNAAINYGIYPIKYT